MQGFWSMFSSALRKEKADKTYGDYSKCCFMRIFVSKGVLCLSNSSEDDSYLPAAMPTLVRLEIRLLVPFGGWSRGRSNCYCI